MDVNARRFRLASIFDGPHDDCVAVHVVCDHEVTRTVAGDDGETTSLVSRQCTRDFDWDEGDVVAAGCGRLLGRGKVTAGFGG